jgi:hypothetical protein
MGVDGAETAAEEKKKKEARETKTPSMDQN